MAVTGASGGLGLETARALAARGAEVVLLVRDPARCGEALRVTGRSGQLITLDLATLEGVRAGAARLLERWPRIDVLVNNAGVMATPLGRTAQGFELQLGTNHLGHFLLTALVAPRLAADGRVVNVASRGHLVSGMNWDDPHYLGRPYRKWEAYGQSKTANILFTLGLARHGYSAYAVHPGMVATDLYRHLGEADQAAVQNRPAGSEATVKSIAQGAATIAWAATVEGVASGSYVADCAVTMAAPHATDPEAVERLWTWSQEQVRERFPVRRMES
ncbi:SDR family NAD(P)-dependent oxidoreductase [Frankia sp. CNm7]|uniref:SDR family NAD(P)-dependent oxidoreductase n=2 Tax=Frankia nepalensis TaxID=1836974 RepID=A0A937RRI6_9ACTN|nr:SDR family NAD(P)-dependent oxidoreductase [Frankia nepalensis]MBL7514502.1 SDR family NAD(P)-dependent oxidoreductase [Frankia nepalensis]MBL7520542.1 SDR family NAD(P)-dependent oxidoreductase [Frankia nepalensis]MBL7632034.1 SDR family NAD(P)-dependent oxidoreductase [Frankia nepalensis]